MAPGATVRRNLASMSDTLLGLGALALGAALAVLAAASPWLVPILLVPVITLHRGVLVDQFRHAARTDTKTTIATERLAVIAAVTLPITATSSIIGMNVIVNDSTQWVNLIILLVFMATISLLLLRWAKRQGWW